MALAGKTETNFSMDYRERRFRRFRCGDKLLHNPTSALETGVFAQRVRFAIPSAQRRNAAEPRSPSAAARNKKGSAAQLLFTSTSVALALASGANAVRG